MSPGQEQLYSNATNFLLVLRLAQHRRNRNSPRLTFDRGGEFDEESSDTNDFPLLLLVSNLKS